MKNVGKNHHKKGAQRPVSIEPVVPAADYRLLFESVLAPLVL